MCVHLYVDMCAFVCVMCRLAQVPLNMCEDQRTTFGVGFIRGFIVVVVAAAAAAAVVVDMQSSRHSPVSHVTAEALDYRHVLLPPHFYMEFEPWSSCLPANISPSDPRQAPYILSCIFYTVHQDEMC